MPTLRIINTVSDANTIYQLVDNGVTVLLVTSASVNKAGNGVLIHVQRLGKGSVSDGQQIFQFNLEGSTGRVLKRVGLGDNTTINWSNWVEML